MDVGDTVQIAELIELNKINYATDNMRRYCGMSGTITKTYTDHGDLYWLDVDNGRWLWHHTLLVPRKKYVSGDEVTIVNFVPNEFNGAMREMCKYIGGTYTIDYIDDIADNMYRLLGNNEQWLWHISLLKKVKTSIRLKHWPLHYKPK